MPPADTDDGTNAGVAGGGTTVVVPTTGTPTGGTHKPGQNLQNVIRNNPISKAINDGLKQIHDSLHKKPAAGAADTDAPAADNSTAGADAGTG